MTAVASRGVSNADTCKWQQVTMKTWLCAESKKRSTSPLFKYKYAYRYVYEKRKLRGDGLIWVLIYGSQALYSDLTSYIDQREEQQKQLYFIDFSLKSYETLRATYSDCKDLITLQFFIFSSGTGMRPQRAPDPQRDLKLDLCSLNLKCSCIKEPWTLINLIHGRL